MPGVGGPLQPVARRPKVAVFEHDPEVLRHRPAARSSVQDDTRIPLSLGESGSRCATTPTLACPVLSQPSPEAGAFATHGENEPAEQNQRRRRWFRTRHRPAVDLSWRWLSPCHAFRRAPAAPYRRVSHPLSPMPARARAARLTLLPRPDHLLREIQVSPDRVRPSPASHRLTHARPVVDPSPQRIPEPDTGPWRSSPQWNAERPRALRVG
jgi:hypothetical protein